MSKDTTANQTELKPTPKLRYLSGLGDEEIARALGCTVKAVRNLKTLRKKSR